MHTTQPKPKLTADQPLTAILAAKIARIDWLSADNHEDRHPSFVRRLAESQPAALTTPPPAIFDLGTVRLGSGSITAEFPRRR